MRGFYAIVDPHHCGDRDPLWVADAILEGGCCRLQLRDKHAPDAALLPLARALRARCQRFEVPFVVNDRVALAREVGDCDLHLGQDDLPLSQARALLPRACIGLSTHDLEQAQRAMTAGADLIGFGPVFATATKQRPDPTVGLSLLRQVCERSSLPVVAIGGIGPDQVQRVADAGASMVAAIAAVCAAPDPAAVARTLHSALRAR